MGGWPWLLPWKDPLWMIAANFLFWPALFLRVWLMDRWDRRQSRKRKQV